MQAAMLQARKRILLIGWDFDTRIHLTQGRRWWQKTYRRKYPSRLGSFVLWLARHNDDLEIKILKWSVGVLKFVSRGSMTVDLMRWFPNRQIDFKFDTAHPIGCSHHQKIVVIDDKLAVCGGIDMTTHRWDTREHLEHDERRRRPRGTSYGPWHDATMMIEGDVAKALSELGRDRWIRAGGKDLGPVESEQESLWPEGLDVGFENVEIGIARTRAKHRDWEEVMEVRDLFVRHIKRAKKFIYAESQYFASRVVAEAISERLEEDDPPEIFIVHPQNADGWLEQQAMDHARAQLVSALRETDKHGRFTIWNPYSGITPIYVHAKIMIVDDEILRIGSANINNRSLGLDSECDLFIDAERPANAHCKEQIRGLRLSLLAEHNGLEIDEVAELLDKHGSMAAMVDSLDMSRNRTLQIYEVPELSDTEKTLAESAILDPETPGEMFEPYSKGGLFRKGGRLRRAQQKIKRRLGR
ncbi:phospholipase [Altererythrobacter sp. HHU K3-1]|uniref:Phospholipase D n=2 Tax=Qipengyuania atrilutea TaxID=2744473 RepID=A0A850H2W2_9SPHN|nr:phospholipase [Actirhodobacter atriluteus]